MWQYQDDRLYRKFIFADFSEAFAFMARVAMLAESAGHHPTIHNTWNVVELWLSTHSAGDTVTDKDHQLAEQINSLLKEGA